MPGSYLGGWVKDIALYSGCSRYQKSNPQFRDAQRWITGATFVVKFLSVGLLLHPGMTAFGRHGYNVRLPRPFPDSLWQPD